MYDAAFGPVVMSEAGILVCFPFSTDIGAACDNASSSTTLQGFGMKIGNHRYHLFHKPDTFTTKCANLL